MVVDILEALASHVLADMRSGIYGKYYDLPKIHSITNADLKEFDDTIKGLTKKEDIDVMIFHPNRIKREDGELIFCRLTLVGGNIYHLCLYTQEEVRFD